jgi:HPt (histidine-containing phosphotransfer) domain-containing protein
MATILTVSLQAPKKQKKESRSMAALNIAFAHPETPFAILPSKSRPIDLVHLASQTMGDKTVETEVLQIFARQARKCVQQLSTGSVDDIRSSAHLLKGAALAVGAFGVSNAAEALEQNFNEPANIARVGSAVLDAENFILKLCR